MATVPVKRDPGELLGPVYPEGHYVVEGHPLGIVYYDRERSAATFLGVREGQALGWRIEPRRSAVVDEALELEDAGGALGAAGIWLLCAGLNLAWFDTLDAARDALGLALDEWPPDWGRSLEWYYEQPEWHAYAERTGATWWDKDGTRHDRPDTTIRWHRDGTKKADDE